MNTRKKACALFAGVTLLSVLLSYVSALEHMVLQQTIDDACEKAASAVIWKDLWKYLAVVLMILAAEMGRKLLTAKYEVFKLRELRQSVCGGLMKQSMQEYGSVDAQESITTITEEVDMVVEDYYMQLLELVYSVLLLVFCILALVKINPILMCIVIGANLMPIVAATFLGKWAKVSKNVYLDYLKKYHVKIGDMVHGFLVIKMNQIEKEYLNILNKQNMETMKKLYLSEKRQSIIEMLIGVFSYGGVVLLLVTSAVFIINGKISVGDFVAALKISDLMTIPTNSLSFQINSILSMRDIRKHVEGDRDADSITNPIAPAKDAPIQKIELQNLSFGYEGQDRLLLRDMNLNIERGKKYLILGENGTGKSTLFKLMLGIQNPDQGEILVDGTPLADCLDMFYRQVGVIFQDTFLFNDSYENNLSLFCPYSPDKLTQLMNQVTLDKFCAEGKLQEEYSDTQNNLSGGEKQRIALIRILLQEKKVIFMDEGTASVDQESTAAIENYLLNDPEITFVNIEHKVSEDRMRLYDRIIRLQTFSCDK